MIYGSDCQGLLKPIQFQDSGSHFLSFMAHLMNFHYQLTCFIIVKTLIETAVLEKKIWGEKQQQSSLTTFFPLCPKLLCLRFAAHHLATQRLADLADDSPLTLLLQSCAYICWASYFAWRAFSSPDGKNCWKWHFGESFSVFLQVFQDTSEWGLHRWCQALSVILNLVWFVLFLFHKPTFFGWNTGSPGLWLLS